jgi:hypothetical protein
MYLLLLSFCRAYFYHRLHVLYGIPSNNLPNVVLPHFTASYHQKYQSLGKSLGFFEKASHYFKKTRILAILAILEKNLNFSEKVLRKN